MVLPSAPLARRPSFVLPLTRVERVDPAPQGVANHPHGVTALHKCVVRVYAVPEHCAAEDEG